MWKKNLFVHFLIKNTMDGLILTKAKHFLQTSKFVKKLCGLLPNVGVPTYIPSSYKICTLF